MEILKNDKNKFLKYRVGNINVVFSTAEGNLSFNKRTEEGINNLNKLKDTFKVNNVVYLNQIHSDIIYELKNNDIVNLEGDAIITDEKSVAIGVFNADCVPVIIVDEKSKVIAAIHSGWKGTIKKIVYKTIMKMIKDYNCKEENLKVFIGPHNKVCCYEVSEELIDNFKEEYVNININEGRHLNLEKCIISQINEFNILPENINLLGVCTHCSKEYKLFSYRKSEEREGRLFSFVYIE